MVRWECILKVRFYDKFICMYVLVQKFKIINFLKFRIKDIKVAFLRYMLYYFYFLIDAIFTSQ